MDLDQLHVQEMIYRMVKEAHRLPFIPDVEVVAAVGAEVVLVPITEVLVEIMDDRTEHLKGHHLLCLMFVVLLQRQLLQVMKVLA